jgi:hypothetical protein
MQSQSTNAPRNVLFYLFSTDRLISMPHPNLLRRSPLNPTLSYFKTEILYSTTIHALLSAISFLHDFADLFREQLV